MWADAASLLHQGELLPDDLVLSVMQDAVEASGSGGYVLDGFPRPDTDPHDYEPTPADAGRWPRRARRGATLLKQAAIAGASGHGGLAGGPPSPFHLV